MPSNLNALLIAWALSLIVVVGGVLVFEVTYDPDAGSGPAQEVEDTPGDAGFSMPDPDQQPSENSETQAAGPEASEAPSDETGASQADSPAMVEGPTTGAQDTALPRQNMSNGLAEDTEAEQKPSTPAPTALISGGVRVDIDPAVTEQTDRGPLPRVSNEGRRPFDVYSSKRRPTPGLAKIALIITDLGLRANSTRRAITDLPAEVTLAFSPYGSNLVAFGEQARRMGHEVLLMVPMEPSNYPQNDPGPYSLLTSRSPRENINLMRASMATLTGYVGLVTHMGSRFTAASESLRPVLEEVQRRGLLFVDSRSTRYSRAAQMARAMGVPTSFNNTFIDQEVNSESIADQLEALENRARVVNFAVGMGRPYPITIDAVKVWSAGLRERGFELVPISLVADQQPLPR